MRSFPESYFYQSVNLLKIASISSTTHVYNPNATPGRMRVTGCLRACLDVTSISNTRHRGKACSSSRPDVRHSSACTSITDAQRIVLGVAFMPKLKSHSTNPFSRDFNLTGKVSKYDVPVSPTHRSGKLQISSLIGPTFIPSNPLRFHSWSWWCAVPFIGINCFYCCSWLS